jgi:hypothetical protein
MSPMRGLAGLRDTILFGSCAPHVVLLQRELSCQDRGNKLKSNWLGSRRYIGRERTEAQLS